MKMWTWDKFFNLTEFQFPQSRSADKISAHLSWELDSKWAPGPGLL